MKIFFLLIVFSFLFSCNNVELQDELSIKPVQNDIKKTNDSIPIVGDVKNSNEIKTDFTDFFNLLPTLNVGYKAECYDISYVDIGVESKFIPEISYVLGRLEPIDEIYLIVYVYAADLSLPILEMYDVDGNKLNDFQLFDYGFCTDLLEENQFSSFEIIEDNKIEILSYKTYKDSVNIVKKQTINLLEEVNRIISLK